MNTPLLEFLDGVFFLHMFVVDYQPVSDGQMALIVAALQSLLNLVRLDAKFLTKKVKSCVIH